jgi:hypothetical protein
MSDALELRAWRFLAQHRVGSLAVTHVQFIDGPRPTINTLSTGEHYEQAAGDTFGAAAVDAPRRNRWTRQPMQLLPNRIQARSSRRDNTKE